MLTPLPHSITKKTAGKHYVWSDQLNLAREVCEKWNCEILLTDAPYQIAKVKCEGVCLVLYPHTNSNCSTNIRVRDEQSKDARHALFIADVLDKSIRDNTFYMKARHKLYERAKKQN